MKVFSDDHPALAMMVVIESLWAFAAEVDAALVLWALKVEVSMPASCNSIFNHLLTVSLETGLCGF